MQRAAHDRLVDIDVTIPDFKVKTAFGVGANPGFIVDSGTLTAEIRQGHQFSGIALLTFGVANLFHGVLLPTVNMRQTILVYTKMSAVDKGGMSTNRGIKWRILRQITKTAPLS